MFGTGNGFTADEITTGYLSADRIEAYSITADKLSSEVGQQLILSSTEAIRLQVENAMSDIQAEDMDMILSTEMPNFQIYDPNAGGGYAPDWEEAPLVITPRVTIGNVLVVVDSNIANASAYEQTTYSVGDYCIYDAKTYKCISDISVAEEWDSSHWIEIIDGTTKLSFTWTRTGTMTQYEQVSDGTGNYPKGALVISKNFGDLTVMEALTYSCTARFQGISTAVTHDYILTKVTNTLQAKSIELTGQQIFHYDTNDEVSPSFITLYAHPQNVDVAGWYYKDSNGEYVAYPSVSADYNGSTLNVYPHHQVFIGDIATIRVLSTSSEVWDEAVIVKVRNGASAKQIFLTNESFVFSADKDGNIPETTVTTDIVYYNGDVHSELPEGNVEVGTLPQNMTVVKTSVNGDVRLTFRVEGELRDRTTDEVITSGSVPIEVSYPEDRTLYFKFATVKAGIAGSRGNDGAGIESIKTHYKLSNSATKVPSFEASSSRLGSFILGMSQLGGVDESDQYTMTDALPYLWAYDEIVYTDGRVVTTDPRLVGAKGDQGSAGINFMLYTPNGTALVPGEVTQLRIEAALYEGATRINSNSLIHQWWKLQGANETYLSEHGPVLIVNAEDVISSTSFRCSVTYRGSAYTDAVTIIDKTDTIIKSATEPSPAIVGMLWLDISRSESNVDVLKRCVAIEDGVAAWEEVTVTTEDLKYIYQTITQTTADFNVFKDSIQARVERTESTQDTLTVNQTTLQQTADKISLEVTQTNKDLVNLSGAVNDLQGSVGSYFDFTDQGMIIGKKTNNTSDPFRVKIDNEKLAFLQNEQEIAYVSNQAMYIKDTRIEGTLSMGDVAGGWWDWVNVGQGLALKWNQQG